MVATAGHTGVHHFLWSWNSSQMPFINTKICITKQKNGAAYLTPAGEYAPAAPVVY